MDICFVSGAIYEANFFIINEQFVNDMKKEGLWNNSLSEAVKDVDGDVSLLDIPEKYKEKYKLYGIRCTAHSHAGTSQAV